MKIAHFVSLGMGGADKCSLNIVRGLCELGHKPLVFYSEKSIPKYVPGFHEPGYAPLNRRAQYDGLVGLIKIDTISDLAKYNFDILHTQRSGEDLALLPGLEKAQLKYKIVETNFHGIRRTRADVRAYPSETLMRYRGIQKDECNVRIYNAIDIPRTDESLRESLGLQGKFIFGRIARPEAHSPISLQAYAKIETENTAFLYAAPTAWAREEAKRLGIKNILFVDQVIDNAELSKIYNTFDVLCHGNTTGETFGNTIAEGMIHKSGVVCHFGQTNWPQAQQEVLGDKADLCVGASDVDSYAAIMKKYLEDSEFYKETVAYLHNRATTEFGYISITKKYLKLYQKMLESKNV